MQMGTTSSNSMQSSAGCRHSAVVACTIAATGTIQEPLLYGSAAAVVEGGSLEGTFFCGTFRISRMPDWLVDSCTPIDPSRRFDASSGGKHEAVRMWVHGANYVPTGICCILYFLV